MDYMLTSHPDQDNPPRYTISTAINDSPQGQGSRSVRSLHSPILETVEGVSSGQTTSDWKN